MFEEAAFHGARGDAEMLMRDPAVRNLLEQDGPPIFSHIAVALHYRRAADIDRVVQDCAKANTTSAEVKRTCFMALVALGRLDDAFRLGSASLSRPARIYAIGPSAALVPRPPDACGLPFHPANGAPARRSALP